MLLSELRGRQAQDADFRGQLLSGCWSEQASSSHPGQAQPEGSGTEVCVCPAQQGGARGRAAGGLGLINTTLFGCVRSAAHPVLGQTGRAADRTDSYMAVAILGGSLLEKDTLLKICYSLPNLSGIQLTHATSGPI